jgi:hypothetical protein
MTTRIASRIVITILFVVLFSHALLAQGPPPTVLRIDVENFVRYVEDTADPSRYATNAGVTPASVPRNFGEFLAVADIVAVNDQPAKGTYTSRGRNINLSPTPAAGGAISDTTRNSLVDTRFEILSADGTAIGSIMGIEIGAGTPPPGAIAEITQGNNAIVGGTGAYLGVRGYFGQAVSPQSVATRMASMSEDPGNRRTNGGGKTRFVAYLIQEPQLVPNATSLSLASAEVRAGSSFSSTFTGALLDENVYFDVRFRAPGSTTDLEASNWQKGVTASHSVPAGTPVGDWIFTGIRPHRLANDHTGTYVPVSVKLTVLP